MALHPYTEIDIDNENFKLLERFTMIFYDKNCDLDNEWSQEGAVLLEE